MDIIMRPGRADDLPDAMRTLREEHLLRDPENLAHSIAFWEKLIEQRRGFFHITEDHGARGGSTERVVGASFHLFITAEFAEQLRSGRYPFALLQLIDLDLADELPVLSAQEIRDANTPARSPSLIMFVLAGLLPVFMFGDAGISVREQGSQFAAYSAAGYNLAEFLIEAPGPAWLARSQLQGMSIRTDNAPGLFGAPLPTGVPESCRHNDAHRPYLMGVTREEALNPGGGAMARLFAYVPPRCRFTSAEQDLLRYALSGLTDEDLAAYLDLSPATVRKRWRGIYDRLNENLPDLLPSNSVSGEGAKEPATRRSLEKKRRLLNYLRSHLEELRPSSNVQSPR